MKNMYDNRKFFIGTDCGHWIDGYFSVEAALVMPIVLTTIAFVIYLLLFTYNRCLAEQDIGIVVFRGVISEEDNEAKMAAMRKGYREIYQDKYFAWHWGEPDFLVGRGKVSVEQTGSMETLFPRLDIPEASLWKTDINYRNEICNPVTFVRRISKLTGRRSLCRQNS